MSAKLFSGVCNVSVHEVPAHIDNELADSIQPLVPLWREAVAIAYLSRATLLVGHRNAYGRVLERLQPVCDDLGVELEVAEIP